MKPLLVTAFVIFSVSSSFGQQPMQLVQPDDSRVNPPHGARGHWCATPALMASPEGQAALARYQEARRNGTLPQAPKGQKTFEIGQIETFNIQFDSAWFPAEFELRTVGKQWRGWVRSDVADQAPISDQMMEDLRIALDERTPPGSINPDQGVFDNDTDVFGIWPTYPPGSDGIIDALIYELTEGVAGFVHPSDFDPNAPDTLGNQSEIMYLDLDNFFTTGDGSMASVTAHELQHVIHLNYDNREAQFVNEGQSEYAQQMNGYPVVPPFYLFGPAPQHNIPFFRWEGLNSFDYMRSSLFTGKLAEMVGPDVVGLVTQSDRVGLEGYQDALAKGGAGMTFTEALADFHTANFINDKSIDPRFGYVSEQRTAELGRIQVPRFDGTEGDALTSDSLVVQPGGAFYLILDNVTDLNLAVDVVAPPDQLENRRSQMLVRAIASDLDGEWSVTDFNPSDAERLIEGSFDRVYMILVHLRPESTQLQTLFEATWIQDPNREVSVVGYSVETTGFRVINGNPSILAFQIDGQGRGAQATRFLPPEGATLDRITLATFYFSQFGNANAPPPSTPRDFKLTIWESNGFGEPGEEFYSQILEDPLPFSFVQFPNAPYPWFDVNLDPALTKTGAALPDTIFVGLQNAGTDNNYLILWPTDYNGSPPRETGFVLEEQESGELGWTPLWDFARTPNLRPLNRTALPIRVRFVIDNRPVAVEQTGEIPDRLMLEQNYPNPFNPSTQIRFALPESQEVNLEVFDVTGRLVTTLLDGNQPPGSYIVTVDASTWTSGLYFYRLTAGGEQMVKQMVVMK